MIESLVHYRYMLLLLAVIPLAQWTLSGQAVEQREAVLAGYSIEVPYLAPDSQMHWIYAGLSAILFLTAAVLLLNGTKAGVASLLFAMLFTGTVDMFLLLAFQTFAAASTHQTWSGGLTWMLLHYLLGGIAMSYQVVDQDNGNFIIQLFAYICGVGFCEETTKLMPVLYRMRQTPAISLVEVRVIGFISGIGFGVAEGVLYSVRQYNGHVAGNVYAIRFLSAVLFHGMLAATASGFLFKWRFQDMIPTELNRRSILQLLPKFVLIIFPAIFLHALYDVLSVRGMFDGALCCELIVLAILAHQIDQGRALTPLISVM